MRAISTGSTYKIFDDTLRTYEKLPVQTYVVRFDRQTGFYLEKYVDISIPEEKIYGVHIAKIEKVLASFDRFNRSLGVILSGDKGIGKSLFAKLLSIRAIEKGIPLIVVDTYYPGIASYLEAITQETMVLFDEFDKTFGEVRSQDGEASPQTGLLSLFDGISGGKKLYVITCNELYKLNEYLVNRPGRFHYHFRFDYPSALEIREYMMDKIPEDRYGEIDEIISFATKVNLNYDCLRAIAFEICAGETFKSAIRDLNIINLYEERYEVILLFKNGYKVSKGHTSLDLFGGDVYDINFHDARYNDICTVYFSIKNSTYDLQLGGNIIPAEQLEIEFEEDKDLPREALKAKQAGVSHLLIRRKQARNLHYAV